MPYNEGVARYRMPRGIDMHKTRVGGITLCFDTNKIRAEVWNGPRYTGKDLTSLAVLGRQAEPLLVAICRRLTGLRFYSRLNVLTTASALGDTSGAASIEKRIC
jgi:hypothetical protein